MTCEGRQVLSWSLLLVKQSVKMRQKVKFAGISARCAVTEDELRLDVRYAAVRVLFAVFRTFLGSVKVRL